MTAEKDSGTPVEHLLDADDLADALEDRRFKQFLDQVPVAIAVAELNLPDPPAGERIIYANLEFERLTGQAAAAVIGRGWADLPGHAAEDADRALGAAIARDEDFIGAFVLPRDGAELRVDAWSNVIEDDGGAPLFRLVALVETGRSGAEEQSLRTRIRDQDTLLKELQHRVKNNLQMITALIRLESRNLSDEAASERFDRLAGRVEALALLYRSLSDEEKGQVIDLGVYLSQIASAVMGAHAVEGIRLDMKVDTWPVSINVAMPTGLAVNELLTNALKHAFIGREGGTITLHSLVDAHGCRVVVADDGIGLPEGAAWPRTGKLGALIVNSLRDNANASVTVDSRPGAGVRVTMFFARADATPEAADATLEARS
ncbi:sensor histidine kinase [Azorhizobium doebereinerae]|uniref:sensor histidine kinase n=1 Tax=Azorhizobium doebereinerae TaxID=281091 RepID=UPI0003FC58FD|nr:PAS domain-containing sensor histidine kinase [Azorhizobium doebereinerae]